MGLDIEIGGKFDGTGAKIVISIREMFACAHSNFMLLLLR